MSAVPRLYSRHTSIRPNGHHGFLQTRPNLLFGKQVLGSSPHRPSAVAFGEQPSVWRFVFAEFGRRAFPLSTFSHAAQWSVLWDSLTLVLAWNATLHFSSVFHSVHPPPSLAKFRRLSQHHRGNADGRRWVLMPATVSPSPNYPPIGPSGRRFGQSIRPGTACRERSVLILGS